MGLHHCRDVWLLLALLASISIQAQDASQPNSEPQVPTIKTEANVVLVDVVVTKGKGEPVVGLHKEDFQVSEDGHPQTISFFEEHTGGTVSPVAFPPMPPGVFTNYPTIKTTDSINVLLLDSLNTQAIDQTYVRPQMKRQRRPNKISRPIWGGFCSFAARCEAGNNRRRCTLRQHRSCSDCLRRRRKGLKRDQQTNTDTP